MNKRIFFVSVIALAVITGSFGSVAGEESNRIISKAGAKFNIILESNATTGYRWQLAKKFDPKFIQLVKSEYQAYRTGRVGSGGKEIWVFKALRKGKTFISLKYVRPWEKEKPPVASKLFCIEIR